MELRQLRYFVAVADTLNFSRAAETLYISQSALSKQIADLEAELGASLFKRDKRSVELTQAGALLRDEAKGLLMQSEKLGPMLRNLESQHPVDQTLFVGIDAKAMADPGFRNILTESVYSLRKSQLGLRALFRNLDFRQLQEQLLSGELDVAFILDSVPELDDRFDTLSLWEEEMVLVFRGARKYSQADIPDLLHRRGAILLEGETRGMAQIMRILDELGIEADIRFCDDRDAMTLTIESGESTAILPMSVVKKLNNSELQVFRLDSPAAKLYLLAAWPRGKVSGILSQLLEDVEERVKSNL